MQIEAEKLILASNGVEGLATVALRPSGIFGEWDRVFVPQLIQKAKEGKMKYIIGSGHNLMEFTYAKNVADAHVLVSPLSRSSEPRDIARSWLFLWRKYEGNTL